MLLLVRQFSISQIRVRSLGLYGGGQVLCTHGTSPMGPLDVPQELSKVARQFLDEICSLIQRNSQDEVLGVFSIKNLVLNDLKRERL